VGACSSLQVLTWGIEVAMAFDPDLPAAARRTLIAAHRLSEDCRGVAGYLYGIAAECAVKALALELGQRDQDVLYAHFPELRTLLRDRIEGRRAGPLANLLSSDAFMNNWHIKMRYAGPKAISDQWVKTWRDQATRAVELVGTLGA
jgi:hypothetical protein